MLRGSVVIFTGIFSYLFLKRRLRPFRWFGMFLVLIGTVLVGLSNYVCKSGNTGDAPNPALGNVLIICAQVSKEKEKVVGGIMEMFPYMLLL